MPTVGSNFSRYVIPSDLAPEGICCISVPVPRDRQWIALFMGALWRLTLQTHYERDAEHSGRIVAARWRQVFEEVRDDMGRCTPSDAIIRATVTAEFRLALRVEFTANGLNGIAPDRPDTFFDEDSGDVGDEVQQRSNALCNACVDYINTVADNAIDAVELVGATGIPALAPIVFVIAPLPGAIFIGALSVLTALVIAALGDDEIRRKVACCMYDNLQGQAITEANFNASLTGCGFAALSDEEIIRAILEGGVNDSTNYLSFVKVLGSFFGSVGAAQIDCMCGLWEHTFDFELENDGWTDRAEDNRPFGNYVQGTGWVSEFTAGPTTLAEKLYAQIADFPSRTVIKVEIFFTTTGSGVASRDHYIRLKLADAAQDDINGGQFPVPGVFTLVWQGSETADEIEMHIVSANLSDDSTYIMTKCIVTGEGTDPF